MMMNVMLMVALASNTAKIFSDKGSTYFRTDNHKVLSIGAELDALDSASKPVGKVVVMEVNGALARISLDDDATRAGAKLVALPKVALASHHDASPPFTPPELAHARPLSGRIEDGALRVTISNDSDQSWGQCTIVYSDGRYYDVGEVVKHTDDTVMKLKFSSPPAPPYDHLEMVCSEGASKFYFDKPQSPAGSLRGYATNEGRGSVMVYNQSETAWTGCDVRKPDGTHYVLGNLKGHQSDSIDRGRFKKEEDASPKWIELRCKEGVVHSAL
jgi:hypothetical protein